MRFGGQRSSEVGNWGNREPSSSFPAKFYRLCCNMSFKIIRESFRCSRSTENAGDDVVDSKEEEAVKALRELLLRSEQLPAKYDDRHTLVRFLRMRDLDVEKAKEVFVAMLKWRHDHHVDEITKTLELEEYDAVKRWYPHGFHGVDRGGRPLYIERIGATDMAKLLQVTTPERLMKNHIFEQERTMNLRFPSCSRASGRHIASTTGILDVKGVNMNNFSKPARELFAELQRIDSNYYPETLNKLYIINAGPSFRALWKVLRAFIEARTLAKIQVLGNNYLSTLLEAIEPGNLPSFLGGSCTCAETGGCLMKDKGPWTDDSEFVYGSKGALDQHAEPVTQEPNDDTPRETEKIRQSAADGTPGDTAQKQLQSPMCAKMTELDEWLAETNKILEKLALKQQELSSHIEQLKKLAWSN